ncbi:magnesium transporter MgtE N-terminal domain-containing protein [Tengunoibacter tsumagoiensis]|uniref:Magnesium transporter n=1 Tax=Tengunoibacter tsumagoiensis TaxID=2014871 RepID=A0A402A9Y9_9CHLR|nr:CBS domain-containing protein [Tengunoibacter tsumagoiensis]GCE15982.1 magnesium transporter [Tengunoibacter tsumagoiensis]
MTLLMFSQLVGIPLLDARHEKVATLKDVIVSINPTVGKSEETYPALAGLIAHAAHRDFYIPAQQIAEFTERHLRLSSLSLNLEHFARRVDEILLGKDVLDKQLVDIEGRRVVRVNDLALGVVPGEKLVRLLAVDVSFRALSRRILPFGFLWNGAAPQRNEKLLDWADVQYFASNAPAVQLHVSHDRLEKLHPADLARLLDDLSYQQRDEIMQSLSNEAVADALESMTSDEAASILEEIAEERASDILEEMRPDVAADVVSDMEDEKAEALLSLMESEDSDELRELLAYQRNTAGGLMTNEFLFLSANLTVSAALQQIREQEEQPEFADYIYLHEPGSERLLGIVSLRELVFCPDRSTPIGMLMESDIVSVHPTTPERDAAALLTEYGLRALPVVEEDGTLVGIITFDDALDILLPDELRDRVAKIFTYRREGKRRRMLQGA